jgi:lysozyme
LDTLNLIKQFEGCQLRAYKCPAGVWTIGYGHTGTAAFEGNIISQQEATELLEQDVRKFKDEIGRLVKVTLNTNQYAAVLSFVYNLGSTNFAASTLLVRINDRKWLLAAMEFQKWSLVGGVRSKGLLRRRLAEAQLFVS